MSILKSPFFWFVLAVLTTAGLTALGPEEQSLGSNVRIVYLHGAWVLTAEAALGLSAARRAVGHSQPAANGCITGLPPWGAPVSFSG